jgi:hypothetical protein
LFSPRESPAFSLSIGARKNSLTKYAARVWDYDPSTRLLSKRPAHDALLDRQVRVDAFMPLIIGEDVRGIAPDGDEVWLGELTAFTLNEPGISIPRSLLP